MEEAFTTEMRGKIRALGVSNFNATMLTELSRTAKVQPAVNQARMTVGAFDSDTAGYCKEHGITYQAYSVLHAYTITGGISGSAAITKVAGQVAARWGRQPSNQQVWTHDTRTPSCLLLTRAAGGGQVVMRWITQL